VGNSSDVPPYSISVFLKMMLAVADNVCVPCQRLRCLVEAPALRINSRF
jgi:hypothetical protein